MALKLDKGWTISQAAAVGPQLYRILRERIIAADLLPGIRISESEIARSYATSRQPVREAFIKLAEDGLVEVRPQRGTFVRKITAEAVMDARFVREAIEADVVKLLTTSADEALVRELRRQIAEQSSVPESEAGRFITLDEQFHRTLAEAAGKSYAWKVIEDVKSQMDRVRFLSARHFPIARLIRQHEAVVDGIAAGDAEAADRAIRTHLREILTDLPAIAEARPELFESPVRKTVAVAHA